MLCISPYIFCWLNVDIIFASLNYRYSATVVTPEHHLWFWISIHHAFQYNRIPLSCHCNPRCCYVWVVYNRKAYLHPSLSYPTYYKLQVLAPEVRVLYPYTTLQSDRWSKLFSKVTGIYDSKGLLPSSLVQKITLSTCPLNYKA